MLFLWPIWLLALLPWAGFVLWMLIGRRRRVDVPFLRLWGGPHPAASRTRQVRLPPRWIVAVLVAVLLAIIAAAGPAVRTAVGGGVDPLVVILDRGLTMSAGRPARFVAAWQRLREGAARAAWPVRLVIVPGDTKQTDVSDGGSIVQALAPTAVDTVGELTSRVIHELSATAGPVVLLSDRALDVDDPRLIQITPGGGVDDVGIVLLAAREQPRPQVMVRVRNQSSRPKVTVQVRSGESAVSRDIDLPPRGAVADVFLDLAQLSPIVEATITPGDDLPANDRAWLVRQRSWPRLEPRGGLPAEVQRVVEAYASRRPPGAQSARLVIAARADELPRSEPAIWSPPASISTTRPSAAPTVVDHPVNAAIDWNTLLAGAGSAADPGGGWQILARAGSTPLLAVREEPARQAWVNLDASALAASNQFVLLWTNMLDWAGRGGEEYAAALTGPMESGWQLITGDARPPATPGFWPGIYQSADGRTRAVNAPDVVFRPVSGADWPARLTNLIPRHAGTISLSPVAVLLALIVLIYAIVTWPRRESPLRHEVAEQTPRR